MLKKLKKLLMVLLIVPAMFVFGACKDKDNNDNNGGGNPPTTQNPSGEDSQEPTTPENPDEGEDLDPVGDNYSVVFDYNLPEGYRVVENYSVTKDVGENVEISAIGDENLNKYFLGWYNKDTEEKIETTTITGLSQQTITLQAKWSESALKNFYYTPGLTFEQTTDLESVEIMAVTGYTGTSKTVILPKLYEVELGVETPVRKIADECFKDTEIESVLYSSDGMIIGKNAFENTNISAFDFSKVIYIDQYAFSGSKLASVTLGSLTENISVYAFSDCIELVSADLSALSFITEVPQAMFLRCEKLENVTLSESIDTLAMASFSGCSSLENVEFLDGVTTIESNAFKDCSAIKTIVIPSSVTALSSSAFSGCRVDNLKIYNLFASTSQHNFSNVYGDLATAKNVTILGDSVTSIPEDYFSGRTTLISIVMADSVTTIGGYAFSGCVNLAEIKFSPDLDIATFNTNSIQDTAWYNNMDEITYIGNALFYVPSDVSGEVVIRTGIKNIVAGVFQNNTGITSVKIPTSVEVISNNVFSGCTNLQTVEFETGSNLKSIGQNAFKNCSSLSGTFNIPASVETIATGAFSNANISAFMIDDSATNFATSNGILFDKNLTTLHTYPKAKTDTIYVIPSTVTLIKNYSFMGNANLEALIINSALTFEDNNGATSAFTNMNNNADFYILSSVNGLKISTYQMNINMCYELTETDVEYIEESEAYTFSIKSDSTYTYAEGFYFTKLTISEEIVYFMHEVVNVSGETFEISYSTRLN